MDMTPRVLAILAFLAVLMAVGCGPAAEAAQAPAPPPAVHNPDLTEREAISVVKSWLAQVPLEGSNCLGFINQVNRWGSRGSPNNWRGEYVGDGKWTVRLNEAGQKNRQVVMAGVWHLFEKTLTVVPEEGFSDRLHPSDVHLRGC